MNKPTIDTADRLERLARDAVNLTGYVRIVMNDAVKRLRELERENAEFREKVEDLNSEIVDLLAEENI